jgi:hypothetical protein
MGLFLAFAGGCLGASTSALGGFVLMGAVGLIGFACLLAGQEAVLSHLWGASLLTPSVCFLGGVVAAAHARKRELLFCGKDIGRSLVRLRRPSLILVGGLGGLAGFVVERALNQVFHGRIDTVAATVFIVPLALKYAWKLTRTHDCEGSSHAVPSPYRFFERLSTPAGKVWLAILSGGGAAVMTWGLARVPQTAPYAALPAFCLSAVTLLAVFFSRPVPATHHYTGPAGMAAMLWMGGRSANGPAVAVFLLWCIAAALVGLVAADRMGRLFFDEGDIHVDPPAMGILISSVLFSGVLASLGIFRAPIGFQILLGGGLVVACVVLHFKPSAAVRP